MCVFGSGTIERDSKQYNEIVRVGELLGKLGFNVISGGYFGTMEAISKGASLHNGEIIGITCKIMERLDKRKVPNKYLTKVIGTENLEERTDKMFEISDLFTVFNGNSGTHNEWIKLYELMKNGTLGEKQIIFYKIDKPVMGFVEYLSKKSDNKGHLFCFADSFEEYKEILRKH